MSSSSVRLGPLLAAVVLAASRSSPRVRRLGQRVGSRRRATKAQEAVGDQGRSTSTPQPRDKLKRRRHDPLGGRPVLDAVELQPARRADGRRRRQVPDGADAVRRSSPTRRRTLTPNPDYLTSAKADDLERQAGRHLRAQPEGQVVRRHADHLEGLRDPVEGAATATDAKYQIAVRRPATTASRASSAGKDEHEVIVDVHQAVRRLEVAVVSPLYPAKYQDTARPLQQGLARTRSRSPPGPFKVDKIDKTAKTVTMVARPELVGRQAEARPHHHPRARERRAA